MSSSSSRPERVQIGEVIVELTFAEAFPMTGARLVVTAMNDRWVRIAADVFCGYATSVIACDLEAGVERLLSPDETLDGRPGVALLAFAFSRDKLQAALVNRVGQCLLTCPTTACYDGYPEGDSAKRIKLGDQLRFFGDGHQQSKQLLDRRFWRIPTMDGEFLCEDRVGTFKGVAGGNLLIGAGDQLSALAATELAAEAIRAVPGVILPFPGGIVRSGSKVGSKYKGLKASTNAAYCPSLRGGVDLSQLPGEVNAMYEIVIDGTSLTAVTDATAAGLNAALRAPGVRFITSGNYGGKLGPHHVFLNDALQRLQSDR